MTLTELRQIAAATEERRGWDFSRVCDHRDPVPWDYEEVVRRYLRPDSRVLDIGTGGGERFLGLAPYFGAGVGIDANADMVRVARENVPPDMAGKVSFAVMLAEDLRFADCEFDIVLNRHSSLCAGEVARVLRPDGVFITQQVGPRNTQNIYAVFGCGPGGEYQECEDDITAVADDLRRLGCAIVAQAEYDVRYYFRDVESFVFWLKAIPMPEDFDIEKHWRQVDGIITRHWTRRGLESNEHRLLQIARKG